MKTLLASALALGVLSSTALAEPIELTDAEMDGVTAAGFIGFGTFRTDAPIFGRTVIPPLFNLVPDLSGDRFDLPSGAVIVIGDDGIVRLRDRKDIRFALPTHRDLLAAPGTVIIIKDNIFVVDGDLPD